MEFDKIVLSRGEKRSLRSFYWKPKQVRNEIKYFRALYHEYRFINDNYTKEKDALGQFIPDGTYSLTERYEKYKIYRREKILFNIPNWFTVVISLASLIASIIIGLMQLGLL